MSEERSEPGAESSGAGVIARFCAFILDRFRDEAQVRRWETAYRAGGDLFPPEGIYNVSDMLLWMFAVLLGTMVLKRWTVSGWVIFYSVCAASFEHHRA